MRQQNSFYLLNRPCCFSFHYCPLLLILSLRQLILQGHFPHLLDAHIHNKPIHFRILTPDIPVIAAYTSVRAWALDDRHNHISELPSCCNAIGGVVLHIEQVFLLLLCQPKNCICFQVIDIVSLFLLTLVRLLGNFGFVGQAQ